YWCRNEANQSWISCTGSDNDYLGDEGSAPANKIRSRFSRWHCQLRTRAFVRCWTYTSDRGGSRDSPYSAEGCRFPMILILNLPKRCPLRNRCRHATTDVQSFGEDHLKKREGIVDGLRRRLLRPLPVLLLSILVYIYS